MKDIENKDIYVLDEDAEMESADSVDEINNEDEDATSDGKTGKKRKFRLNTHWVLLFLFLLVVGVVIYKFYNWGEFIGQDEIFQDGIGTYSDTMDLMVPLLDENGKPIYHSKGSDQTILLLGNGPFADDRNSKNGLAKMIEDLSGAKVINCSVSGSYMACENISLTNTETPMDAFAPYWLVMLASLKDTEYYIEAAEKSMGKAAPKEAPEVRETLRNLDLNDVDVLCMMYDGTDYLLGHGMYSDTNHTDIQTFTGNMEAAIEWVQNNYPHIRIIILSPSYAFSNEKDENGKYISSDIIRYGQDVFSTYVIKQGDSCSDRQVTFVDNLYGTITEENAEKYLSDNLHMNKAGRRKVAERFVYALNYFNED